ANSFFFQQKLKRLGFKLARPFEFVFKLEIGPSC
ncbi:MAG: hypothetical protein ACI94O_001748, partial [Octadecabacter sp.]